MAIVFSCHCGQKLSAKEEYAGREIQCPSCQSIQIVPAAEESPRARQATSYPKVSRRREAEYDVADVSRKYRPRETSYRRRRFEDDIDDPLLDGALKARVEPVSMPFYLGSYISSVVLLPIIYFAFVITLLAHFPGTEPPWKAFAVLGLVAIPIIYNVVVCSMLIYKMWNALARQDFPIRTTPGSAVGLMFVPLFNAYWVFQSLWGWMQDYNELVDRRRLDVPRMPEGLGLATAILWACTSVPCLNYLTIVPSFVLLGVFIGYACNGINALANADVIED